MTGLSEAEIEARIAEIMSDPAIRERIERLVADVQTWGTNGEDPAAIGRLLGWQIMRELGHEIEPSSE